MMSTRRGCRVLYAWLPLARRVPTRPLYASSSASPGLTTRSMNLEAHLGHSSRMPRSFYSLAFVVSATRGIERASLVCPHHMIAGSHFILCFFTPVMQLSTS